MESYVMVIWDLFASLVAGSRKETAIKNAEVWSAEANAA